ncbi:carcinine hydrolase/isopenicillin-N N-acyltransferase family protein [Pantoea agglomerans]|uniref:carcinine hydrolase/isopenicillin-N N-acyltransferase family protein n=1 Tax=Enterobacter agglomerans TaxID=549 RepID=UPI00289D9FBC|nr:carcinine hydrolase/isopenicillin-N N-acyltransferase family protein [Pantoea agglomerans]WNK39132.1 hypothetical protein RM160_15170 [Pantoea agglomerans]
MTMKEVKRCWWRGETSGTDLTAIDKVITDSSASHQQRLDEWQKGQTGQTGQTKLDESAANAILYDQHDAVLPIYRLSPQDPDEENTLATAIHCESKRG